jgi:hypothetical protein
MAMSVLCWQAMRKDDQFEKAIASGKRNAEVMELMNNWCAHARARRMGGVGMIEQMTGLPISHFSMECDHAPEGGMAAFDFGESALDFYDRNCVTCTMRKPVGLPNLSKLVNERDEERRIAAAREKAEQDRAEQALRSRSDARTALRKNMDAVNQAIIDDLDAYDREHDEVDRKRLVEAARLAPERIDKGLVDLLFDQASASTLLALIALEVACHVAANERRTLLLAQRLFRNHAETRIAPRILVANVSAMKEGDITDLVPAAANLASPDRSQFLGGQGPRSSPKLLLALWKERPEAVRAGIDRLLDCKTVYASQLAGRAMRLIIRFDPAAAITFVRAAASRYVRAKQLLPDLGEYENLGDMAGVLDLILNLEPQALDAILQDLIVGADIEAKRNIANIYAEAWRGHYPNDKEKPHPEARLRLGLDRLLWLPAQMFDSDALHSVCGAFRYPPDEVWPLIEQEADKLVGAALILDDLIADKERGQAKDANFLQQMEWQNLRSAAYDVAEHFLKAAAKAAQTREAKAAFITAIHAIPEERGLLRGLAAKAAIAMAGDVEGLKAVLPTLYSGLVGADVLGRAYAATALSEIPARGRQNLPVLVYEAFCVLLLDQFVAVHKSAVRTLGRISLPDDLKPRAAFALFNLVSVYSDSDKDDDFLIDCIDELARLADHLPHPDKVRDFCCHATLKAQPLYVRSEVRSLLHSLKKSDDFPLIVAHVLPQYADNMNQRDVEGDLVRVMTAAGIRKHRVRLVEVGKELAGPSMWLATLIADALYRAGARDEASGLLEHMEKAFRSTVKDRSRALFVGFPLLAYKMEQVLAAGDDAAWNQLVEDWNSAVTNQKTLLEDRRARDSRSRFSFPH